MPVTKQSVSSVLRQVLAVLGIVFAVLTQALSGIKLPVVISAILGGGGALILAIEHYVSDPSTGTPVAPVPLAPSGSPAASPSTASTPPASSTVSGGGA